MSTVQAVERALEFVRLDDSFNASKIPNEVEGEASTNTRYSELALHGDEDTGLDELGLMCMMLQDCLLRIVDLCDRNVLPLYLLDTVLQVMLEKHVDILQAAHLLDRVTYVLEDRLRT